MLEAGETVSFCARDGGAVARFAYRDRRVKKRTFRGLWITRIGAAAKLSGLSYSQLIKGLKQAKVELDRKMLAELAVADLPAFRTVSPDSEVTP